MEISGLTPIDTLYEFAGYSVSLQIGKYLLWSGYIVGFLLSAALVRLYYLGSREGSFKDLAAYPVYVLFIFFLLYPIEVALTSPMDAVPDYLEETVFADPSDPGYASEKPMKSQTIRVPRILAYVSALVGTLQKNLVSDVCDDMHTAMYQWKHVAAINTNSRIFNPRLREDLDVYLKCCYYPALSSAPERETDPWKNVPFSALLIDGSLLSVYDQQKLYAEETHHFNNDVSTCTDLHRALDQDLTNEISTQRYHQKALGAYNRLSKSNGNGPDSWLAYAHFYRRRLVYNEIYVLGTSSTQTVREALPEYSLFKGGLLDFTYITSDPGHGWGQAAVRAVTQLPRTTAAISSAVTEGWAQKAIGPATYYRVSALGPYIYGLLLAFLVMAFPLAGLLAFWPGWWTSLVNFMKLFISIKLWPVFWAFLSGMIEYRSAFNPEDPEGFQGTFGSEGMLPALCIMYLVVPVFSFMVTSLAQHAGGMMLGSLLDQGQAASLGGTVGAVTRPAAAVQRMAEEARH